MATRRSDVAAVAALVAAAFVLPMLLPTNAAAEPTFAAAEPTSSARKHLVYGEALGKLGLYGLGYEFSPRPWLSFGAAASTWQASSRRVVSASSYVGVGTAIRGRHRWFAQLGPEVIRESEPSVAGFDGLVATGIGGQLTSGYEHRGERLVFRAHVVATFGKGGIAPWGGLSLGLRL